MARIKVLPTKIKEVQLKTADHGNKNGHSVTNFPKLLFPPIPVHQKQQPEKIWHNNGSFNHINNWVAYISMGYINILSNNLVHLTVE